VLLDEVRQLSPHARHGRSDRRRNRSKVSDTDLDVVIKREKVCCRTYLFIPLCLVHFLESRLLLAEQGPIPSATCAVGELASRPGRDRCGRNSAQLHACTHLTRVR
jgi:hypothetical protein